MKCISPTGCPCLGCEEDGDCYLQRCEDDRDEGPLLDGEEASRQIDAENARDINSWIKKYGEAERT